MCRQQVRTTSGGVKYYFSYTVQNPSPAYYDFMGQVDANKTDGQIISIPWSESKLKNADSSDKSRRQRRSVDETADWNVTVSLYGAVVGDTEEQNDFDLIIDDEYEELVASSGVAGKLIHMSASASAIILLISLFW